jgi:hypothetical protein
MMEYHLALERLVGSAPLAPLDARTRRNKMKTSLLMTLALGLGQFALPAQADGTEQLGSPGIPIVSATHSASAGVGLNLGQPGTISLAVPAGAVVKQVLVYWEGLDWLPTDHGATAPLVVGGVGITGNRIGGPTDLFGSAWSSTFRADITGLNLVGPGANLISVSGSDFTRFNNGAGIVALYDLPGATTLVQVADGNDIANELLAAPGNNTAPLTFTFPPQPVDRSIPVDLFFASFFADRASVIYFLVDGAPIDLLIDAIGHGDGPSWTTVHHDVFIPAGSSTLTIQAVPLEIQQQPGVFKGTAKFVWLTATVNFEVTQLAPGGLTPGFWKNHAGCWDNVGKDATQTVKHFQGFNASFGVTAAQSGQSDSVTLLQAAGVNGGGKNALARHAAAALANADSKIGYAFSLAQVKALYRDGVGAVAGPETVDSAKNQFEAANEKGYNWPQGKPCSANGGK